MSFSLLLSESLKTIICTIECSPVDSYISKDHMFKMLIIRLYL